MTEEIAQLKNKVEELEQRIERLEETPKDSQNNSQQNLDRYDQYVLDNLESDSQPHPRRLMKLYSESGIVDKEKKKQRAKRLLKVYDWS